MKRKSTRPEHDGFPQRLAALRKRRSLTQLALAGIAGCGIRRLARALHTSSDDLLFGEGERGPDAELRLQFEAVSGFDREEKRALRALLEGMILKHEARRWSSTP